MTNKQTAFVREYLKDFNATQAAIRAGYSPRGARTEGARLLANANIQGALQEYREKACSGAVLTLQEALESLTAVVRNRKQSAFAKIKAIEAIAKLQGWEPPQADMPPIAIKIKLPSRDSLPARCFDPDDYGFDRKLPEA